jgi:hypothetical protein
MGTEARTQEGGRDPRHRGIVEEDQEGDASGIVDGERQIRQPGVVARPAAWRGDGHRGWCGSATDRASLTSFHREGAKSAEGAPWVSVYIRGRVIARGEGGSDQANSELRIEN